MNPAQEGEDYGKGVIFYLRENKVIMEGLRFLISFYLGRSPVIIDSGVESRTGPLAILIK